MTTNLRITGKAILGLLRDGEVRHGYVLIKAYVARGGRPTSGGNFYRELHRLACEGLVRTTKTAPGADARQAPYQITDTGARAFDKWFSSEADVLSARFEEELSTRALFLVDADPPSIRRTIERWRDHLSQRTKTLEVEVESARRVGDGDPKRPCSDRSIFIARSLRHLAADLAFVEDLLLAYGHWFVRSARGSVARPGAASGVRAA
jgi:DNA-binding PadR family transcriptional regulator